MRDGNNVINIAAGSTAAQPKMLQTATNNRNKARYVNPWVRRKAVARFLLGKSFRAVAREVGNEEQFAQDLREAILQGGQAA